MFAFVVIYRCTLADSVLCVVSSKRFAELVIRVTATEDDTQAQRITDSDGNGGWRFECVCFDWLQRSRCRTRIDESCGCADALSTLGTRAWHWCAICVLVTY
jgi:hypothetical protein